MERKGVWLMALAGGLLVIVIAGLAALVVFPLEREDYKVYPTAETPADFYGRVYAKTRIEAIRQSEVTSPAQAGELAGFPVRLPTVMPDGLAAMPVTTTMVMGPHAYQVDVNLNEARALLEAAGLPTDALPAGLDRVQVTAAVPPGAIANQTQEPRFLTLIQARAPVVTAPAGFDPALLDTLSELGLRYLGLGPADARQLSEQMGWASFLVLPPADMDVAEPVRIGDHSGYALHRDRTGQGMTAVLWEADGVLYGLYSNVPVAELLPIAESLK